MKFYISQNKKPLVRTGKIRKFISYAKKIDWTTKPTVYLKVSYGRFLDNFGNMTDFQNDGDYTDEKTFWIALGAFVEDYHKVPRQTQHFLNLLWPSGQQGQGSSVRGLPLKSSQRAKTGNLSFNA